MTSFSNPVGRFTLFVGRPGTVGISADIAEPAHSLEDTLAWLDLFTVVHWLHTALLAVGTGVDTDVMCSTSWHLTSPE